MASGGIMTWTRGRVIAAAAAGAVLLVVLGVVIGRIDKPAPPVLDPDLPPLPTGRVTNLPPEVQKEAEMLARSAIIHVFFHEAAHMLISELKIPATGPQEDVADEFASFVVSDALRAAPDEQKGIYTALMWSGMELWRLLAARREREGDTQGVVWYDEHSPDMRRYYNVMCLATGADPLRFIPMAVKAGVPQARLNRCAQEYATKHEAWDQLMKAYAPGFWHGVTGGHRLKLDVGPAGKSEYLAFEAAYKQNGFFQQMLDGLSASVALPRDIPVVVRSCGKINAWWSARDGRITLCHEFFEFVTETFADALMTDLAAAQQGGGGGQAPPPQPQPQPQPVPQPGGTPQASPIMGTWFCQGSPNGMPAQEQLYLGPDGQFRSQLAFANGQGLLSWGRWSVSGNILRLDLAGTNPQAPIQSPVLITFQMIQPNMFQTPSSSCQRTGS
jgi:hypothetical protein